MTPLLEQVARRIDAVPKGVGSHTQLGLEIQVVANIETKQQSDVSLFDDVGRLVQVGVGHRVGQLEYVEGSIGSSNAHAEDTLCRKASYGKKTNEKDNQSGFHGVCCV